MPKLLPCPNRACTNLFVAEEIKGATSLRCPRCGAKFKLRPPKSKPVTDAPTIMAKSPLPPAKPPPEPPVAEAVPPDEPFTDDPGAPPSDEPFPDTIIAPGDEIAPTIRRPVSSRAWPRSYLIGIGGGVAAVIVAIIVFVAWPTTPVAPTKTQEEPPTPTAARNVFIGKLRSLQNADEKVFQLSYPNKIWSANSGMRTGLKVIHVLQRSAPDAWLAITSKDYGSQKPRDSELLREALEKLEGYFGETLELSPTAKPVTVAGQKGQSIEFRGQANSSVWRGECRTFSHHGIGYWLFAGAPSLEEAQTVFTDFQKDDGFAIINERKSWVELPPKRDTFAASKLPLTLTAPVGVWQGFDPTDEDEHCELLLRGIYAKEKDNRKNARIMILALPMEKDFKSAVRAARDYVEKTEKNVAAEYALALADESSGDEPEMVDIGNQRGAIIEFKLQLGTEPKRYIVLAVFEQPENVVAIRAECTWESRQIWRSEFLELLAALKGKK